MIGFVGDVKFAPPVLMFVRLRTDVNEEVDDIGLGSAFLRGLSIRCLRDFRTNGPRSQPLARSATAKRQSAPARQMRQRDAGQVADPITDRAGLEAATCGCYRAKLLAYAGLLG
jgi:hypothetical protein